MLAYRGYLVIGVLLLLLVFSATTTIPGSTTGATTVGDTTSTGHMTTGDTTSTGYMATGDTTSTGHITTGDTTSTGHMTTGDTTSTGYITTGDTTSTGHMTKGDTTSTGHMTTGDTTSTGHMTTGDTTSTGYMTTGDTTSTRHMTTVDTTSTGHMTTGDTTSTGYMTIPGATSTEATTTRATTIPGVTTTRATTIPGDTTTWDTTTWVTTSGATTTGVTSTPVDTTTGGANTPGETTTGGTTAAPTTSAAVNPRRVIPYQLVMDLPFRQEYIDRTTDGFIGLENAFIRSVSPVFVEQPAYVDIRLIRFAPGSVVARFVTIFSTEGSEPESIITQKAQTYLQQLINNGTFVNTLNFTGGVGLQHTTLTAEELHLISNDPSLCNLTCGEGSFCQLSEKYPGVVISECACKENYYPAGNGVCQNIPAKTANCCSTVSALTAVVVVLAILLVVAIAVIVFHVRKFHGMSRKADLTEDAFGTEYATIGGGSSPVAPPRRKSKRTAVRNTYTPATSVGTAGQQAASTSPGITNTASPRHLQNKEEESPYQALNPDTMESKTYTSLGEEKQKDKTESTCTSLGHEPAKETSFYQNMAFVGDQGAVAAVTSKKAAMEKDASKNKSHEALEMSEYEDNVYLDVHM